MGIYQHGLNGKRKNIPDEEAPGAPWYRVADSPPAVKTEVPPSKKKR